MVRFNLRQNPHRRAVRISNITIYFQRQIRRRRASRSIGLYRASPHSYGGAFYSVTCSQRKYHDPRICIVARSFAQSCFTALVVFAHFLPDFSPPFPVEFPCAPAVRLNTYGTYLIALFSCHADCFRPAGIRPDPAAYPCPLET